MQNINCSEIESKVFNYLKSKININNFKDWFSEAFITEENELFFINLPNEFNFEWVNKNYFFLIQEIADELKIDIKLKINKNAQKPLAQTEKTESAPSNQFTFENFIVGKSNQMAFEAAFRTAKTDKVLFNPLFIHGSVGLGKTHLLQAIVHYKKTHFENQKILYLSAEQFMNMFVKSIQNNTTMNFKEEFRSADVLLIDDFQFLSSKQGTQEAFFHLFNSLIEEKKQLVISADKPPSELPAVEQRIKSRLGWGLVIDVHIPSFELKLGILQKKIENYNVTIDNDILSIIANQSISIRELEGLLLKIIKYSEWMSEPITKDFVNSLCETKQQEIKSEMEIIVGALNMLNVSLAQIQSSARNREIVRARQIIVYLLRKMKGVSYLNIGKLLGNKDHTSIMYAEKQAISLQTSDLNFALQIKKIEKTLV